MTKIDKSGNAVSLSMKSKTQTILTVLLTVLLLTSFFAGCIDTDIGSPTLNECPAGDEIPPAVGNETVGSNDSVQTPDPGYETPAADQISIAAFNIQIFGQSKAAKDDVMEVLTKTIRRYDIVGIQEIRDASGTSLPKLVEMINGGADENGNAYNYDYVVSDRLGRSSSKEQYAYIYNANNVFVASEPLVYPEPDGTDPFEREPYMVTFRANDGDFDALFILIHTKPDDAKNEINELDTVVQYAKSIYKGQENYVVMGDFNADGSYFNESGDSALKSGEYIWLIGNDEVTTTKSKNTYDRIVITTSLAPYFTNVSGVFNYSAEYGLTEEETHAVSDHYPVFAEFWTVVGNWFRMLFAHMRINA
ncbi:exonuclease/endonuclease/phosphatase family protein [Methanimicrococcus hacksteinii]|uniref:exonuclease/endonuclease/phosphatase family protein n=1 Tax=Methanimicrococcus hacksteinii TaxID=3028293 RepID=UPI00298F3D43|nr:endonuclease/exonuclease/phosphatase family protein [Methanimicrococcus sp. At1]